MEFTSELVFYVNGKKVVDGGVDPSQSLLSYLRLKLHLTGSKEGCSEGGCGACTVMVSWYDTASCTVKHVSVNACLMPVCSMHGMAVTTVEGIGSTQTQLHAVQERIAKAHGSQCGFCTPGFVMSMYTLLRNKQLPSQAEMERAIQGNLCRCTGYRPILEGFKTFTEEYCCKLKGSGQCCMDSSADNKGSLPLPTMFKPYDPTQDPIFPPDLMLENRQSRPPVLRIVWESMTWYQPNTLAEVLALREEIPGSRLVAGNTRLASQSQLDSYHSPTFISIRNIQEMRNIQVTENDVKFGSSYTVNDLEVECKKVIKEYTSERTRIFQGIIEMMRWFGSCQIRNVASLGGNIAASSASSDLIPLLIAAGSSVELISSENKTHSQPLADASFFKGEGEVNMRGDEMILSVSIPFTTKWEYFAFFKQSARREFDTAIVNACMYVKFKPETIEVEDIRLVFGGVAPTCRVAACTMKRLWSLEWTEEILEAGSNSLLTDIPLSGTDTRRSHAYKATLAVSFFYKFYLQVQEHLSGLQLLEGDGPAEHRSAAKLFDRGLFSSCQAYESVDDADKSMVAVGRPLVHLSAYKHACGEAVYYDDMPYYEGELHLAYVLSTKSHAKILSVDPSKALALEGVQCFVDERDVPGKNSYGPISKDEEIFANGLVRSEGQIIAGVVASSRVIASKAVQLVKVEYEELKPVVTIQEAIDANQYLTDPVKIVKGDLEAAFKSCNHTLDGQVYVGGQEHFYMEPQGAIAVPKLEDGEMEIFVVTQHLAPVQKYVGEALNVAQNKIVVRAKRIGGGFGGKETSACRVILPVSVAARKCKKPVRCVLSRKDDMLITGGRHPALAKYKVGFTKEGKLTALDITVYLDGGYTVDLTPSIMESVAVSVTNAYRIPTVSVTVHGCKTNLPSNTAFRGFGRPQAMFICESFVNDIALHLNRSSEYIRGINLFKEGDITHFNMPLKSCTLRKCWEMCLDQAKYDDLRASVNKFNQENRWSKRGLAVVPTIYGLGFLLSFFNQSSSLVHIYTDGSVLLAHGGIEMGQGLYTKMIQVAAHTLGIPVSKIFTSENNTCTVANTSPTAGSTASDINGGAVVNACEILLERLKPYKKKNPEGSWNDWVIAAYFDRTSLSAVGFYKTPNIGWDQKTNKGMAFTYFTYGASCSQVEIDCLTGAHKVLTTDIVMDVGQSLNPAIDVGQIEGGFMQGYGLFVLEELLYNSVGTMVTQGTRGYKIPSVADIPEKFNVSLLKGSREPKASVYSSKGIGEPPLFLAASVFFAIKDAIAAARHDAGESLMFQLDAPATCESIRMACRDHFCKKVSDTPV